MSVGAGGVCLSKWYLDCIDPQGEAWVGYHVELRWKAIALRFAGFTVARNEGGPESRVALRRLSEPTVEDGSILWAAPGLRLEGRWDPLADRVDAMPFEGLDGAVQWRCLQPASRVRLRVGDRSMTGFGYAEQLVLTLPPWQLPIAGLRWGRFVTQEHALVWIDWEGSHGFRLLAYNGRLTEPGEISDERITSQDGTIELDLHRRAVLRDAALGETLASLLPRLPALPKTLLGLTEQKWIAKGSLRIRSQARPPATGWVIHERVRWPTSAP